MKIQDALELAVVGADVEALYTNLSDVEVAMLWSLASSSTTLTTSWPGLISLLTFQKLNRDSHHYIEYYQGDQAKEDQELECQPQ